MNVQRIMVVVFLLLITGSFISIIFLPEDIISLVSKEWGPIENVQVIFYLTGSLLAWIYAKRKIWDGGYQASLILLIFTLRELDFQKRFTGISITRTKYYFHSDATLLSKLLGAMIVISIIVLFVYFIKKNIKIFYRNVRTKKNWALSVIFGLICILFGIFTDSFTRVMESFGVESIKHEHYPRKAFEELFELAASFFFLNSLLLFI